MTKTIDEDTAALIAGIQRGDTDPGNISAVEAVALSSRDFLLLTDGKLYLTNKAERALRRFEKYAEIDVATEAVRAVIDKMLIEPGAVTQHRAVWNNVGRERFERDTVLQALNALKAEGLLSNHRTSGNNFQVFWKRTADVVKTPGFETN